MLVIDAKVLPEGMSLDMAHALLDPPADELVVTVRRYLDEAAPVPTVVATASPVIAAEQPQAAPRLQADDAHGGRMLRHIHEGEHADAMAVPINSPINADPPVHNLLGLPGQPYVVSARATAATLPPETVARLPERGVSLGAAQAFAASMRCSLQAEPDGFQLVGANGRGFYGTLGEVAQALNNRTFNPASTLDRTP
jgi:hypothetical protein